VDDQLQREKNGLMIYNQSHKAIMKEDMSNTIANELKIIFDDQIEQKLSGNF
jgi:hypothetical protein